MSEKAEPAMFHFCLMAKSNTYKFMHEAGNLLTYKQIDRGGKIRRRRRKRLPCGPFSNRQKLTLASV